MANIVYYGGVGDPASLNGALDYCVAQGYNVNGQETHIIQNGDVTYSGAEQAFRIDTSTNIADSRYAFSNTLYFENPNRFITTITDYSIVTGFGIMTCSDNPNLVIIDGLIINGTDIFSSVAIKMFYSYNGKMLIKNCVVNCLYNSQLSFLYAYDSPSFNMYNCVFVGGGSIFSTIRSRLYTTQSIEDCVFVGSASWGQTIDGYGVTSFKRCYSSLLPDTANYTVSTGGIYTSASGTNKTVSKSNVPFNEATFFNISDPTDPLYLVPRPSYDWETIDQTTNIPENTVSKNGVTYTGSNRAVGCMALPDNVVEPVLSPITKAGGNSVLLSWTGTNGGVIYTNETNDFATSREVATATTGNSYTYEVPLADRGKAMYYWVEVL